MGCDRVSLTLFPTLSLSHHRTQSAQTLWQFFSHHRHDQATLVPPPLPTPPIAALLAILQTTRFAVSQRNNSLVVAVLFQTSSAVTYCSLRPKQQRFSLAILDFIKIMVFFQILHLLHFATFHFFQRTTQPYSCCFGLLFNLIKNVPLFHQRRGTVPNATLQHAQTGFKH